MTSPETQRKIIHIHVGPHKTGSTAIQHALNAHKAQFEQVLGITPITHSSVRDLARALIREDQDACNDALAKITALSASAPKDVLISCEDLAGDLPGRTAKRRIYPRLWQNLNQIRKAFPGCDVRFYFFIRDPQSWLRSAYVQLLKHRAKFRTFDGYQSYLNDIDRLWDGTLQKVREKLAGALIEIPYEGGPDYSAIDALLAKIDPDMRLQLPPDKRPNTSPSQEVVRLLEQINGSGASNHAIQAAKRVLLHPPGPVPVAVTGFPEWPPSMNKPNWLAPELEPLWSRTDKRTQHQIQPNLMPELDCDLSEMRARLVEAEDTFPEGGRGHMENQVRILAYRFRGKPEICFLLGLTISYLRRNTDCTAHAAQLFQRLWAEEHAVLLGILPTRWLISTLQTFMDHGANEAQRLIGSAAFFLSNTLKLYEAERALDGLAPDGTYPSDVPTTKSGFAGLDRFRVGGTDLMVNTNALLLELASRDAVAGRVAQEFLLRMKKSHTAFSRMDQSRVALKVDIPQFANCWSFFDPPKS